MFQFTEGIDGTASAKKLVFVFGVDLMDEIDVGAGLQIFGGGQDGEVHFVSVVEAGFVGNDDAIPLDSGGKSAQLGLGVSVFRNNGGVVQVAAETVGVFHNGYGFFFAEIEVVGENGDAAL